MSDRLTDLRDLRDLLRSSIAEVEPDKRAPLSHQYRATLSEIAELESALPSAEVEGNGLVDFQKRLEERQSGAKASGSR